MVRFWFFSLQLAFLSRCVRGGDVGPDFDPEDIKAYDTYYGDYPFKSYRTENFTSPVVRRVVDSPECYDGRYLFFTPRAKAVDAPKPVILDDEGHLVWTTDIHGQQPYNFNVQLYQGQPHLTYWLGNDAVGGHGEGYYYMLNSSYQEVAKISPMNGLRADLHEMTITEDGTALISIYQKYPIVHWGRKVYIWDCLFQEIDIAKQEVLFEWRASDHHSLDETYSSVGTSGRSASSAWDWFHLNSVQKDDLGNYLVSARYTHTITYINGKTGETIWILGGKLNFFKDLSDGNATDFASQHYARMHDLTEFPHLMNTEIVAYDQAEDKHSKTEKLVAMFDNGADDRIRVREVSRGVMLQITYPSNQAISPRSPPVTPPQPMTRPLTGEVKDGHTVSLVHVYTHPDQISADSQGSFQVIPPTTPGRDPTIGLGFGQKPVFTEFTADGRVMCDTQFGPKTTVEHALVQSYRSFKNAWVGQPAEDPKAVLDDEEGAVYVSWNGATEVDTWKLQHTSEPRSGFQWSDIIQESRQDFETRLQFDLDEGVRRYLRVAAVDKLGNILGVSNSVDIGERPDWSSVGAKFNASSAATTSEEFFVMTTPGMPLKLAMFSLCAIAFSLTVYGCYRQYTNWQQNKQQGYNRIGSKDSQVPFV